MKQTHKHYNKPAAHTAHHNDAKKADCNCSKDCTCGCQEGKHCTCGCGCDCGCDCNKNGVLVLLGTILIAASILATPFMGKCKKGGEGVKPRMERAAEVKGADLDKTIADFIKNNPQMIVDSVESFYRKKEAEARAEEAKTPKVADAALVKEILNDKTNAVLGNPNGTFVMIEFFDYNCGFCKKANAAMAEAIKKSDNIRWILMDAPIFGEGSEVIARYALAANKQGKFAKYHEALATAKDRSEKGLIALGKELGLDEKKLEKDANSDEIKNKIQKNREYTGKLNLRGVPMFIIDGNIQAGFFPDSQMQEYIKKANEMKKNAKKK